MSKKQSLILLILGILSTNVFANFNKFDPQSKAKNAPAQLIHFGQIIGQWNIKQESLSVDRKTWVEKPNARWNFYRIMKGNAIQDDWIPFTPDPSKPTYGTNIRTYDAKFDIWNIAWLVATGRPVLEITAKPTGDKIVMSVANKNPQGFIDELRF